jgi:glutaminyl-peptide cyclotransferase
MKTMKKLLLLALVPALFIACSRNVPQAKTGDAAASFTITPPPAFNAGEAFGYLRAQTAFGPRVPGSAGHQRCLDYILALLAHAADSVSRQDFTVDGYDGEKLQLTNIFASINPKAMNRILLIAHWDTRPRADQEKDLAKQNLPILGANDGASGVAVLLELAQRMKQSPPVAGVDLLFVDGEDYGKEGDQSNYLLGARYFAKHMSPDYRPAFGILLDMIGDSNLELLREPTSVQLAPEVVSLVWSTAKSLGVYQFTDGNQRAVLDDHIPLNEAGIKTIDLIDFDYPDASNRYWHTLEDTPDKCSAASLEAVGKVLLAVLYGQPS